MVPIKPYTVTVTGVTVSSGMDGAPANNPTLEGSTPHNVQCFFQEMTTAQAIMEYGVTITKPALIQCELVDGQYFGSNYEVYIPANESGSRPASVYSVVGNPIVLDAGFDTDHVDVLLSWKMYPLPELGGPTP